MNDKDTSPDNPNLTPLQGKFNREGLSGLSQKSGVRLVFELCRNSPKCPENVEKHVRKFKSIRDLLSATDQELREKGLCERGLVTIRLLRELPAEISRQYITGKPVCDCPDEVIKYLQYDMRDRSQEVFKVIYLDGLYHIVGNVDVLEGTPESVNISPMAIVVGMLQKGAAHLIFAHNHVSGDPTPSLQDIRLTVDFVSAGQVLGIEILDHIIIGDNRYYSFAAAKLIEQFADDFKTFKLYEASNAKQKLGKTGAAGEQQYPVGFRQRE